MIFDFFHNSSEEYEATSVSASVNNNMLTTSVNTSDINLISDDKGFYVLRNATYFLEVYEAAASVLIKSMDFYPLTRVVLNQSVACRVVYTRDFFP